MKVKEALIKSARADSEGFFVGARVGKGRNTWCISPFPARSSGGKDPLLRRSRFIQSFLKVTLSIFAGIFNSGEKTS